jgi:PAS domain S-box-containing protein
MRPVIRQIRHCAWSDAPVNIQGEAGTGKSVAARIIHNLSRRSGRLFQAIKAGVVPDDVFEAELFGPEAGPSPAGIGKGMFACAKGGTMFIDGLGHIPLLLQTKLAGIMEGEETHSPCDVTPQAMKVRLILGSDKDLARLAVEKRLDEAMHRCLSEPPIVLPPLRERVEDTRFLASKFLWKATLEFDREVSELGEDVLDLLTRYPWPGNIRELESVIRQSVLLSQGTAIKPETVASILKGSARQEGSPRLRSPIPLISKRRAPESPMSESDLAEARREIESQYVDLIRLSPVGFVAHANGRIILANPAFARIMGATDPDELSDRIIFDFVHADFQEVARRRLISAGSEGEKTPPIEVKLLRLDGSTADVEATAFPFRYEECDTVMVVAQDITERKKAEEVARARQKELEEKTASLEEANAALKVLLSHRDEDKEDLEKRILANVKKLVFPYVEKIKAGRLTDSQAAYVEIIESNLTHIISPFLQKMVTAHSHFTPTEIQVADLIKEGKTTKEIASLLNIGMGTVNTHRNGIRAKLGLRNKDVNLRSHLLSFE